MEKNLKFIKILITNNILLHIELLRGVGKELFLVVQPSPLIFRIYIPYWYKYINILH